jgi:hypothetical protein
MQQERRNGHRTWLPGAYVTYESASHAPREAELHDIGMRGLFVPAVAPLPRGTRIAMDIRLSRGGTSWAVLGRVVWTRASGVAGRPSGMGVKIVDIDETAVEAIRRAIGPAPPAREKTVRGIGTPTPPAVWVARGPAAEGQATLRGIRRASKSEGNGREGREGREAKRGRGIGKATAAALLVGAVVATAFGVMPGGIPRTQGLVAAAVTAAETEVVTAVQAPPPAPSETPPAAAVPPTSEDDTSTAVVAPPPASTSPPARRPAPGRAWTAKPKRPSTPPSDNPY